MHEETWHVAQRQYMDLVRTELKGAPKETSTLVSKFVLVMFYSSIYAFELVRHVSLFWKESTRDKISKLDKELCNGRIPPIFLGTRTMMVNINTAKHLSVLQLLHLRQR